MKIVMVTSWLPRHCGIATYSEDLVRALRNLGHEVHIVCHTDGGRKGEENVYPVLNITKPGWDEVLYKTVKKIAPDIVHIQHEYGLYIHNNDSTSSLLRCLFKWKVECDLATVMTYHSVYTTLTSMESAYMDATLNLLNIGIVHEEYQWAYLPHNIGRVAKNVYVISHGAKELQIPKDTKKEFSLKKKKVVGMMGWWEADKGFDRVVKLWPDISKKLGPDCVLVVAGDARPGSESGQLYKPELLKEIEKSPAKKSIKLIMGSFDPDAYDKVLSTFDLIVLPYLRTSQSGNLAHAFALGVPAVVSEIGGLKSQIDASNAGITVSMGDDFELKSTIINLMSKDKQRKHYAENAKKYVTAEIKWSTIAEKHTRRYEQAIKEVIERRLKK